MARRKPMNRLGEIRPGSSIEWTRWRVWQQWRRMGKALAGLDPVAHKDDVLKCRAEAAKLVVPLSYPTWFDFDKAAREWEAGL